MKILVIIIASAAIAAIASVSFFSQIEYNNKPPCTYCTAILSPNQPLQILNITTEPASVSVGNSFLIYADVSNPNPYSVYLNGGCVSPLSATFDKNVETKQGISCFTMSKEEVKSRQELRIQGPTIGTIYNATSVGETNATITFTYEMQGKTYNVTAYKQITISHPVAPASQIVSSNNNSTVENNLGNEIGIMAIGNETYYFDALNDTITAYHHEPVQISFHDVVFTLFPGLFSGGPPGSCGGSNFGADTKFPDGIHELLGIFVQGMPCLGNSTPTNFSIHANPQAGLTFYDGKMKLLVSTKNTFESSTRLNSVVDVVSIQFVPTPPNPGGPTIQLTLMNIGMKPITNLKATLDLNNNYVFNFKDVTESNPLASGHSTSDTEILIGAGFTTGMTYPLTVVGTVNNETFSYTLNVRIPWAVEGLPHITGLLPFDIHQETRTVVSIGNKINGSELVPITIYQVTSHAESLESITDWNFLPIGLNGDNIHKTWDTLSNPYYISYKAVDGNNNDVIDHSRMPDPLIVTLELRVYSATCDSEKIMGEGGHPVPIPIKRGNAIVFVKDAEKGILPDSNGQYTVKFVSMFETKVEFPKGAKIISNETKMCFLENKIDNFTSAFYTKAVFKMG